MELGEVRNADRVRWGKPLSGVRVLAVEQMQALPFATQLLAHLGADVVKIEHPLHGESGRGSRPQITDRDGRAVGATYLRNNLLDRGSRDGRRSCDDGLGGSRFHEAVPRVVSRRRRSGPGGRTCLPLRGW